MRMHVRTGLWRVAHIITSMWDNDVHRIENSTREACMHRLMLNVCSLHSWAAFAQA